MAANASPIKLNLDNSQCMEKQEYITTFLLMKHVLMHVPK
jgi:hypothetical protein